MYLSVLVCPAVKITQKHTATSMDYTAQTHLRNAAARDTTSPASQGRKPNSSPNTEDEANAKERRRRQNRIAQRNHREPPSQHVSYEIGKWDLVKDYC